MHDDTLSILSASLSSSLTTSVAESLERVCSYFGQIVIKAVKEVALQVLVSIPYFLSFYFSRDDDLLLIDSKIFFPDSFIFFYFHHAYTFSASRILYTYIRYIYFLI